jgi:hypothetical protein
MRNVHSCSSDGAPNDGARPPGAGGTAGASGDIPSAGSGDEIGADARPSSAFACFTPRTQASAASDRRMPNVRRLGSVAACTSLIFLHEARTETWREQHGS